MIAIIPGGGTYGMEAVARQFATDQKCMVLRNGWFSFRWSQIFDAGNIPSSVTILKARPVEDDPRPFYAPAPIDEVIAAIQQEKPAMLFAPHVETASGIILPGITLRRWLMRCTRSAGCSFGLHRVGNHLGGYGGRRR